jgi:hypothetical protein
MAANNSDLLTLAKKHHHFARVDQERMTLMLIREASAGEIQALVLFMVDVFREIGELGDRRMWPPDFVRFARDTYGRSSWRPLVRPQMPEEEVS